MKRLFLILLLIVVILLSFSFSVYASDVEGTVATNPTTVPDTSVPEEVTLSDINDSLGVIQSQLWIILVVGLLGYVYKFFRLFF